MNDGFPAGSFAPAFPEDLLQKWSQALKRAVIKVYLPVRGHLK